jgi:predicted RNase H-like HicB family nuclease
MKQTLQKPKAGGSKMKTYNFKVVVGPDNDRWHAYCPALEKQGASTWGNTEEEALKHIHEVVQMIVEELIEEGESIPEGPKHQVQVTAEPRVVVTV